MVRKEWNNRVVNYIGADVICLFFEGEKVPLDLAKGGIKGHDGSYVTPLLGTSRATGTPSRRWNRRIGWCAVIAVQRDVRTSRIIARIEKPIAEWLPEGGLPARRHFDRNRATSTPWRWCGWSANKIWSGPFAWLSLQFSLPRTLFLFRFHSSFFTRHTNVHTLTHTVSLFALVSLLYSSFLRCPSVSIQLYRFLYNQSLTSLITNLRKSELAPHLLLQNQVISGEIYYKFQLAKTNNMITQKMIHSFKHWLHFCCCKEVIEILLGLFIMMTPTKLQERQ